ncbi:MAG: bifunctional serine/threonine-protein kinase/formylglycine-generating enzyme family protein [Gemmataceae bacterium]
MPPNDSTFQKAVSHLLNESASLKTRVSADTVLRDYRLIERIGEGGMGSVYKAVHTRLDKTVAVKVIRPGLLSEPSAVVRFEREMRAVGRLHHPNIVQATDAGEWNGVPFLVMEYLDGMNLTKWVKQNGSLPKEMAIDVARQAALGLKCAHDAGLIHRDVKPSNLMRCTDGTVKVLDLGLAVIASERESAANPEIASATASTSPGSDRTGSDITSASQTVGTFHYMSPEQRLNPRDVDARTDIYGLGATLWFLLTGRTPVAGDLLESQSLPGGLPLTFWKKFLAARQQDRFESMEVAEAALREQLSKAQAVKHHSPKWMGVVASLALMMTLVAIYFVAKPKPVSETTPPVTPESVEPSRGKLGLTPEDAQVVQQEWSQHLKQPIEWTNSIGIKFRLIPPGQFNYSSRVSNVQSRAFYCGETEVTRRQFETFVNATQHVTTAELEGQSRWASSFIQQLSATQETYRVRTDAKMNLNWRNPGYDDVTDDDPVVHVTFAEARAFCDWLSASEGRKYRLPSRLEWAWAARAGEIENIQGPKKGLKDSMPYAWSAFNCKQPRKVGQKIANAWGLYDVCGNAQDWCRDTDFLETGKYVDGVNEKDNGKGMRIVAGGGYADHWTMFDHVTSAKENVPRSDTGFRVVLELP